MHFKFSRREAIGAGLAACVVATKAAAVPFLRREGIPLGVQLYALGEDLATSLEPNLAALARIGYRRVELAGFLGRSAQQLRSAFDAAGLECHSAHIPVQAMFPGQGDTLSDVAKLIDDAHILGLRHVALPMFPFPAAARAPAPGEDMLAFIVRAGASMTADNWRSTADLLNERGAALAVAGLRMTYHNHNFEFAPLGSTTGYQILMERTDPTLVGFEMDAGWVAAAGIDPIALLVRYPGRFRQMHVKDIRATTKPNFAFRQDPIEVGQGMMDWKNILPAAVAAGVREFYVEQEPPFTSPRLVSLEKSFRYLDGLELL